MAPVRFRIDESFKLSNVSRMSLPSGFYSSENSHGTFSQIVAVHNKTELILYGGMYYAELSDVIYKYSQVTKHWMKVGKMLFPRAAHVVLPVNGLSCP